MESAVLHPDVSVDGQGMLRGELMEGGVQPAPRRVRIVCNETWSATVPVITSQDGGVTRRSFTCRLPPVAEPRQDSVEIFNVESSMLLARLDDVARQPLRNGHGLSAHDVWSASQSPMFGVPWISFDGARLTITGAHLPPGGDPGRLSVELAPGVKYSFVHALESKEFGSQFWYYPNAHLSGFILTIDLVASARGSDPFQFDFVYGAGGSPEPLAERVSVRLPRIRQRIWIPKDLNAFVGYPQDKNQLTRVQTWSEAHSVTFTGYNVFALLSEILQEHGVRPEPGVSILDWGCGHGRVTRHFIDNWQPARILGADIDAENIEWCSRNLPGAEFCSFPLMPPTRLAADSLDAVIGVSVATHLSRPAQAAWLQEISRILKPDGLALITFGGAGAAAWGSFWHSPDWWQAWTVEGFDDGVADPAFDGLTADDSYYRVTTQSTEWTRKSWSRYFDVVAIEEDVAGNQNLAVLRRRSPDRRRQRAATATGTLAEWGGQVMRALLSLGR
jgi:SAM-dependent methyltransferase